jgi:hypothetical protein
MDNKDELKICDDWEDEWENCDEIEAKLKSNIEETKKKELQQLIDKAEEDLIEDLFLHDPLLKKVEQKQINGPLTTDLLQHTSKVPVNLPPKGKIGQTFGKGWNSNIINKERSNLKKEDEQNLREKKKKQKALKKRHDELFGDASLDTIQDQYCDFEDRY